LLVVLGGITALAFLGNLFSERTRMPGLILLIGIGLVPGSILEIVALARVRSLPRGRSARLRQVGEGIANRCL
jgi:hypothetical protein